MRTVINAFKQGDATKRLSIASDLVAITSIALAWILLPILTYAENTDIGFSGIAGISIVLLGTVGSSSVLLALFLSANAWIVQRNFHPILGLPCGVLP